MTAIPSRTPGHIIHASPADAGTLSQVIADAFDGLEVSRWLIPDPDARRGIFPGYFRILTDAAFDDGLVLTTPVRDAVALWFPVGPDGPEEPAAGYSARLTAATGHWLPRFTSLDQAFHTHHPAGTPHQHLAILAVRPDRQRHGIGTALLRERHAILDRTRTPAYLEASDLAKRDIYLRHGYSDLGDPVRLPDGPLIYPMWRNSSYITVNRQP
jgi:GNAT superfamily N-acetyltransferase